METHSARIPGIRHRGFTVLELMIAVSIGAILTVVAAPSLVDYANDTRLRAMSSRLQADLQFARLEAVKRNARVLVCAKSAGADTCAAANNWQNGWVVCYDANSDDVCDATSATDPNPLKVAGVLPATLQLTGSGALIRFNPVGTANGASSLTLRGTWTNSPSRISSIAATGYITSLKN